MNAESNQVPRGCSLFTCPLTVAASLDANGNLTIDRARLDSGSAVACRLCAPYVDRAYAQAASEVRTPTAAVAIRTRWHSRRKLLGIGVVLMTMIGAGGAMFRAKYGVTNIASIIANGEKFDTVTIIGNVTSVVNIPFSLNVYKLRDKTGELFISTRAGAPLVGERLRVTGSVHGAPAFLGVVTINPIITEQHRSKSFLP